MRIYLASSWRNEEHGDVLRKLREAGHEVYDFKNESSSDWKDGWEKWNCKQFVEVLKKSLIMRAFDADFVNMRWADVGVLLLPCGKSSHLEAGYMVGIGKPVYVVGWNGEVELTYSLMSGIYENVEQLIQVLGN